MSKSEKFLDRWSRHKREAADLPASALPTSDLPAPAEPKDAAKAPPDNEAKKAAAEAVFDPASLPPIESITAESDIRAFLKPGVPPDLARAALRRAWSADLAIRDFIGLVETPWDFNDPHGVPGFGPMPVGEDIGRLLAQAIGTPRPVEAAPPQQNAATQDNSEQNLPQIVDRERTQQPPHDGPAPSQGAAAGRKGFVQRNENNVAPQNEPGDQEKVPPSHQRGHGGALPK